MFLFSSSAAPPAVAAASFASSGSPHDGVATSFRARLLFRFNSTDSDEATPPPYGSGTTKSPDATLRHKARHERAAGNISCAFSHTSVSRSKLLGRVPRPAFHPALRSSTATDAAELAESSEATDELHVICMVFWTPGSSGQIRVLYTFPDSGVKGRMYTSGGGGRGAKGEYPKGMITDGHDAVAAAHGRTCGVLDEDCGGPAASNFLLERFLRFRFSNYRSINHLVADLHREAADNYEYQRAISESEREMSESKRVDA